MAQKIQPRDLIKAYHDIVAKYPNIPPMAFWRPWEIAYIRKKITFETGLTLDLACGDGKFAEIVLKPLGFSLVGCDFNPEVITQAEKTGIYEKVIVADARNLPFKSESFSNVFSNCAFEHFDDIEIVLGEVWRVLKPGGRLIFTAVNDNFVKWQPFSTIGKMLGLRKWVESIRINHIKYHNLVNPYSRENWLELVQEQQFKLEYIKDYISWLPTYVFLVLDQLWHYPMKDREFGTIYYDEHLNDEKLPFYFDILFNILAKISTEKRGSGIIVSARKEV
ncbi:class I SAM-dependent methyltransferase [Phosphitispora sp. TUW77]|uniref:class I SAM-dependent methyltransferase n=1 Tax=Phosphitispora sp. TUW77 TaxID=3152361 RepID=UPI003AB3F807